MSELDLNLPSCVTVEETAVGSHFVIASKLGSARIGTVGAHIFEWTPTGHQPVLWSSQAPQTNNYIHGGSPICAPWFGPGPHEDQPIHGWFRSVAWRTAAVSQSDDGAVTVEMRTSAKDHGLDTDVVAYFSVTFGRTLNLALRVATGKYPLKLSEAFHPYLAVSDIRTVHVDGLDGCTYVDKNDAAQQKTQHGPVTFAEPTDRVYRSQAPATLVDPGLGRSIRLDKQNSASTIIWNPWESGARAMSDFGDDEWPQMVCVEAGNAFADTIYLGPHQEHTMLARYVVEHLN